MNTTLKIMIIVCIHLHILTDLYHKHKKRKKDKYKENKKIQKKKNETKSTAMLNYINTKKELFSI